VAEALKRGEFLVQEQWLAMGAITVFSTEAVDQSYQLRIPAVMQGLKVN